MIAAKPIYEHLTDRAMERYASYVMPEPNTGCWLWSGAVCRTGYGRFRLPTVSVSAHRVALAQKLGREIRGLALHLCDNPSCVNPDHLREGTYVDNARDRDSRGRQGRGYRKPSQTGVLNHRAKLSEADVLAIRAFADSVSMSELGRRYRVHLSVVSDIVHRRKWKHL